MGVVVDAEARFRRAVGSESVVRANSAGTSGARYVHGDGRQCRLNQSGRWAVVKDEPGRTFSVSVCARPHSLAERMPRAAQALTPNDIAGPVARTVLGPSADEADVARLEAELRIEAGRFGDDLQDEPPTTIADEAVALVYGDREDDYGHPRQGFTRIAQVWTALLGDKLEDGAFVTPEDVARLMAGMKLARDAHEPKRDNRLDAIGYLVNLDRLGTGQ